MDEKGCHAWIKLHAKRLQYLPSSKCSSQSYYECFANEIKKKDVQCIPKSISSIGKVDLNNVGLCENETLEAEIWNELYSQIYQEMKEGMCPKLCQIEEYTGTIDYEEDKSVSQTSNSSFVINARFARPYKVSVSKEYLIYDFIGMVGSVGGTLGMFIGFSFFEVINNCCKSLRKLKRTLFR